MKKLNNKGFAISTLLYGLLLVAFLVVSLLMSIMSVNRKNTSTLIKKIEEELNRYSQTTTEITSTSGAQEFIVPYGKAGWYKIELWGAPAKNIDATSEASRGRGAYTSGVVYLKENQRLYFHIGSVGGAASDKRNNGGNANVGGATDVRTVGGAWNETTSINSRIMVAGGGGTTSSGAGHTTAGFGIHNNGRSHISGYGLKEFNPDFGFINTIMYNGVNVGAGKATIELISTNTKDNPPAKKTTALNNVRYIKDCVTGTGESAYYERWQEIQVFDSTGQNIAYNKSAYYNGQTSKPISNITNNKKDYISGTNSAEAGTHCIVVDLGRTYNLEEIVIYHKYYDGEEKYAGETISVSSTSLTSGFRTVRDIYASRTPTETVYGLRISARHIEITPVPTGNYYIQSALSENRVVTSVGKSAILNLAIGSKTQRWAISAIGTSSYKIIESENELALQPADGGLEVGEAVGTNAKYGNHAWEQWYIETMHNGYYRFKSLNNPSLCLATSSDTRDVSGPLIMQTCSTSDEKQWFKLVNADY